MASTTFCDWCGDLMETRPGDDPAILRVAGSDDDGRFLFAAIAGGFNIHAERAHDGGIHPDSCLGQLEALLEERSSWAHDPEQGGAEWRLVPREGRILTPRRKRIRAEETAKEEREQEWKAREAEWQAWRSLPTEERITAALELLSRQPATISELADRMQDHLPGVRVADATLRPLVTKLFKDGQLDREGERWRAGSGKGSVRYRYFVPEESAA